MLRITPMDIKVLEATALNFLSTHVLTMAERAAIARKSSLRVVEEDDLHFANSFSYGQNAMPIGYQACIASADHLCCLNR